MKKIENSKYILKILDIIIIGFSAVLANLLLSQKDYIFTQENIRIIINSIISSVIVYEFYLHIFKMYRHITRFESGIEYLNYVVICTMSGETLLLFKMILNFNINSPRKQLLGSLITSLLIIGVRVIIRFILNYYMRDKEESDCQKYNILIIGARIRWNRNYKKYKTNNEL